jgi:hypothetical protein
LLEYGRGLSGCWRRMGIIPVLRHSQPFSANRSRAARVCWFSVLYAASKQVLARRRYSSTLLVIVESPESTLQTRAPSRWTFQRSA